MNGPASVGEVPTRILDAASSQQWIVTVKTDKKLGPTYRGWSPFGCLSELGKVSNLYLILTGSFLETSDKIGETR
jgi:hypothetical protein